MAQPHPERRSSSEASADREGRAQEVVPRARRRIGIGLVIGPALGALAGLLVALAVGAPAWGVWTAAGGGAIFGALGAFWGGLSSLRPPSADDDPLEAEDADGARTVEGPLTVRRDRD